MSGLADGMRDDAASRLGPRNFKFILRDIFADHMFKRRAVLALAADCRYVSHRVVPPIFVNSKSSITYWKHGLVEPLNLQISTDLRTSPTFAPEVSSAASLAELTFSLSRSL